MLRTTSLLLHTSIVVLALATMVRAQAPDLSANGISGPLSASGSQTISVTRDITNIGGFVASFTYDIRLSTNNVISATDPSIATFTNQTTFGPQVVQVTIPPAQAAGTYFLGLTVNQASGETNLANNAVAAVQTINISAGPADLVAVSLSGPTMAAPGQQISVTRNIGNAGGPIPGGTFGYDIYLSTNNIISTTDILIGTFGSSTLGALAVNVTVPTGITPGNYFLGFIVAPEPGEIQTANNVGLGNSIAVAFVAPTLTLVTPNAGPPLGGTSVVLTGTAFLGTPTVRFNGALATNVVVSSSTQITCTTPANPIGQPLSATVTVQTTSGTATLMNGFNYSVPLPGSGGDLLLETGVNGALNQTPTKSAMAGNALSVRLSSPGAAFNGFLPLIGAQFYMVGSPPFGISGFPQVHLDPIGAIVLFNGQLAFGVVFPLPASGITLNYLVPSGLVGFALRFQGYVLTPTAPGFLATDGHDIFFN